MNIMYKYPQKYSETKKMFSWQNKLHQPYVSYWHDKNFEIIIILHNQESKVAHLVTNKKQCLKYKIWLIPLVSVYQRQQQKTNQ